MLITVSGGKQVSGATSATSAPDFGNALDANLRVALAAGSRPSHSQAVTLFERELDPDEEIAVST